MAKLSWTGWLVTYRDKCLTRHCVGLRVDPSLSAMVLIINPVVGCRYHQLSFAACWQMHMLCLLMCFLVFANFYLKPVVLAVCDPVMMSWYRCGCEKAACVRRPAAAGSDLLHCCCARGFVSCSTTATCCMSTVLTLALKCEIFFCEFSECVLILMICLNYTFTQLAFKQLVMGLHCLVLFW